MTDRDLEGLVQKDRVAPLDPPELRGTLSSVVARTARKDVPAGERPGWALVASAAAVSVCSVGACVSGGMSPLILLVPALQLMALQALVKKEV